MEAAARAASRVRTTLRPAAVHRAAGSGSRRVLQKQDRRLFSSSIASTSARPSSHPILVSTLLLAGTAAGIYTLGATRRPTLAESPESGQQPSPSHNEHSTQPSFTPSGKDYQAVYNAVAAKLVDDDDYDDGSYAPVLLRLGWHSSGSYDAATNTGGSNGATMRFPPEGELPANSGLRYARDFLEPIKAQFPWISYSDLWTLAAVCAVQEMQGPTIPWRPGRRDKPVSFCSPDGRLPDGSKSQDHVRAIYGRMGFNDQEMVALIGAHAVGRCHVERSGFEGPWTFSPITFTNDFYRLLLEEEWAERDWKGKRQFEDKGSKSLMMLPTDYCLVQDDRFRRHVERYAKDQDLFFEDFSQAMVKLFELGVPFVEDGDAVQRIEFDRTE